MGFEFVSGGEGVGKWGVWGQLSYEAKLKKGKIVLSFASPGKEKYFLFIYEVITWEKRKKGSALE